jgi:hypothetical protein
MDRVSLVLLPGPSGESSAANCVLSDKWGRRGPMVLIGVGIGWVLVVSTPHPFIAKTLSANSQP